MILPAARAHLTYCTNIHPGETWPEVRSNVERYVVAVKAEVAPDRPFGVGLRLGAAAAAVLGQSQELDAFRSFLDREQLYVFTINGFPYGAFHGAPVKQAVYRPDWLEEARLDYTAQLALILARLLPPDVETEGSISTVPGCFRERAKGPEEASQMADRLVRCAAILHRIHESEGRVIGLALEPEPSCFLETVAETVLFFEQHLFGRRAVGEIRRLAGLGPEESERALRRHLGVCLDACHTAVEFEDPTAAVRALQRAGIRIQKLQLSAGLRVGRLTEESLHALRPFAEGTYLHQVVARGVGGGLERYADLSEALVAARASDDVEWRVHFHVPIFLDRLGPLENTQGFLEELLDLQAREGVSTHVEVETYTWDVLPGGLRGRDVVENVARELRWVLGRLAR